MLGFGYFWETLGNSSTFKTHLKYFGSRLHISFFFAYFGHNLNMSRAPNFCQHCEGEGCFCRASKSLQCKTPEVRLYCLAFFLFSCVLCTFGLDNWEDVLFTACSILSSRYSLGMGLNYQQVLKNVPMGAGGPETCYGEILSVKVNICEPWAMGLGHGMGHVWPISFSGGMGAMGLFLS